MEPVEIEARHETAYRMGRRLSCGFSYRPLSKTGDAFEQLDVVEDRYVLVYLIKGQGEYSDVNGNRFELKAGTLFQRFPGVRHSCVYMPSEDHFECFAVMPRQIGELLLEDNVASLAKPVLRIGLSRTTYLKFDEVFQDLKTCHETELPSAIVRLHKFAVDMLSVQWQEDGFLKSACSILERDLTGRQDLKAVAKELGMGYSAFRQRFAKSSGTPPGEYRIRRKIELAQSLLSERETQVKSVAKKLGYPDIYSFSKQFKLHAGATPSLFLKSKRGKCGEN